MLTKPMLWQKGTHLLPSGRCIELALLCQRRLVSVASIISLMLSFLLPLLGRLLGHLVRLKQAHVDLSKVEEARSYQYMTP